MTIETMRETINTIKSVDSLKVVKVAFDLSATTQDSIDRIMQVVHGNVNNINLLAERIAKLEKKLEAYERPKN